METTVHEQHAFTLQQIPVDLINRNLDQPRKAFDVDELEELADSIQSEGLMQPITVRPDGEGGYQIVAGERRWRAFCILQHRGAPEFGKIACNVRAMDDLTRDISAIVENLMRVDIAPLEEASAFGRLTEQGLTAKDIAKRTGKSPTRIEQRLSLLRLAPDVRGLLEAKLLDDGHATEIARLSDPERQRLIVEMLRRKKIGGWQSVAQAVDALLEPPAPEEPATEATGQHEDSARVEAEVDQQLLDDMEKQVATVLKAIDNGWTEAHCLSANRASLERCELLADQVQVCRTHIRNMEKMLRNMAAKVAVKRDSKGRIQKAPTS